MSCAASLFADVKSRRFAAAELPGQWLLLPMFSRRERVNCSCDTLGFQSSATIRPRSKTSARKQVVRPPPRIRRDHQRRRAPTRALLRYSVNLRLGADSTPGGRLLDDQQPRRSLQRARKHDLLLVAAGERIDRLLGVAETDVVAAEHLAGLAPLGGPASKGQEIAAIAAGIHPKVFPDRELSGNAFLDSAAGAELDADPPRRRDALTSLTPGHPHHAAGAGQSAINGSPDGVMTCADAPHEADDLAGVDPKAHRTDGARRETLRPRAPPRGRAREARRRDRVTGRPRICAISVYGVISPIGSDATTRPLRSTVTRSASRKTSSMRWVT